MSFRNERSPHYEAHCLTSVLCPNSASEASCGHTRRGIASSSCTGVRPRPQAIPECSRLKQALLEVAAELRRSVRARTLGLLLLLRAFRPSGRSEKGCERLGHVDEASAGLANAGD
eukprot:scaffold11566_cov38-Phaeocystis_antarctica.AAC.1